MSGNSFGKLFVLTSFGESHGSAIGGVVDGCPAGMQLQTEDIQKKLDLRRPGQNPQVSQRKEQDKVEILSGIYNGYTTGTPIGFIIRNQDTKSQDYDNLKDKFRPGHADYTYSQKYGIRDYRGGGRASARETAIRVVGGAIAEKYLREKYQIEIFGFVSEIGGIRIPLVNRADINNNEFFIADNSKRDEIFELINNIRKENDSLGGVIEIKANGVPAGLGEPVYNKLDANIAYAMMGINAVKAVEIGAGFSSAKLKGSQNNDQINQKGFMTNNAGGILGGISNGDQIVVRIAIKPTSSIYREQNTIDNHKRNTKITIKGRHDPCIAIRAVPIAESMLALVLIDFILQNLGRKY